MMRFLLFSIALFATSTLFSQSKAYIDSLRSLHMQNLHNYEKCLYREAEQEGRIDSIWFYLNNNNIVFIYNVHYQGSDHNAEDWAFNELLLDSGKVLFRRSWGYLDEQLYKPDPSKVMVTVSESMRSYYKYNGESIVCHEVRSVEGPYACRDSLLNTIPLKPKSGWLDCMDRVDRLIEEEYIDVYKKHCLNKE